MNVVAVQTVNSDPSVMLSRGAGPLYDGGWGKIVTHRIALDCVRDGTREERDGYAFVALVPRNGFGGRGGSTTPASAGFEVMPYAISSGGILG